MSDSSGKLSIDSEDFEEALFGHGAVALAHLAPPPVVGAHAAEEHAGVERTVRLDLEGGPGVLAMQFEEFEEFRVATVAQRLLCVVEPFAERLQVVQALAQALDISGQGVSLCLDALCARRQRAELRRAHKLELPAVDIADDPQAQQGRQQCGAQDAQQSSPAHARAGDCRTLTLRDRCRRPRLCYGL